MYSEDQSLNHIEGDSKSTVGAMEVDLTPSVHLSEELFQLQAREKTLV